MAVLLKLIGIFLLFFAPAAVFMDWRTRQLQLGVLIASVVYIILTLGFAIGLIELILVALLYVLMLVERVRSLVFSFKKDASDTLKKGTRELLGKE